MVLTVSGFGAMENRQERTIAAFHSALNYLDYFPIEPEPPLLTRNRNELEASINRLRELGNRQYLTGRDDKGGVERRRDKLRRQMMMPLVRIASEQLKFAPGVTRALKVPHSRDNALTVATSALALCKAVSPHIRLLADAGFTKEHLRELRQEARELAVIARIAAKARAEKSQATRQIKEELAKAMQTLTVIEGIVMLHLKGDRRKVADWKERRRVSRRIGRPKKRRSQQPPAS